LTLFPGAEATASFPQSSGAKGEPGKNLQAVYQKGLSGQNSFYEFH
jgi:hypothetical protein